MKKFSLLLAIALAGSLVPGATQASSAFECARADVPGGEWRSIGNQLDASRDQTAERVLDHRAAMGLEPAWTFDANWWTGEDNNEITGYPIVADGCLYVGSSRGHMDDWVYYPGWIFSLNADTGKVVWMTKLDGTQNGNVYYPVDDGRLNPCAFPIRGAGLYSTVAVDDGIVYAFASQVNAPRVLALDQATGEILWSTVVDCQIGSDAVSSPVVFTSTSGKKYVWVGVSGTAAEGDEAERLGYQGSYVILEAGADGGDIVHKEYAIDPALWHEGYAGGAIWSTAAIDNDPESPVHLHGFVGTGNPFNYDNEHENTNAILKFDLRDELDDGEANPDFAKITGAYKGDVEEYLPEAAGENPVCEEFEEVENFFAAGFECANLDLDFGAMPNIWWTDATPDQPRKRLVGAGQKSGIYHAVDPVTMDDHWKSLLGFPSAVGGIVGSAAYDGRRLYGPHTVGGYLWSIDKNTGEVYWVSLVGDGVHWGNPVTYANGILYTPDLTGFMNAFDAASGAQILKRPMSLGNLNYPAHTSWAPTFSWGGTSVARNTVYTSVGVGLTSAGAMFPSMPNGFVIAFRPFGVELF